MIQKKINIHKRFETSEKFKEFLSEISEIHAVWLGFYSSFFALKIEELPDDLKKDVKTEYHYYLAGHFLGRITQTIVVIIAAKYGLDLNLSSF